MEKKSCSGAIFFLVVLFVIAALFGSAFTVRETDFAIVTQFGRIVGNTIEAPGLHYKTPFIQQVYLLDKRAQEWDGPAVDMPTKDKTYRISQLTILKLRQHHRPDNTTNSLNCI